MWEDPIVKETRAAREELFARFNHNLAALCEYLARNSVSTAAVSSRVSRVALRLEAPKKCLAWARVLRDDQVRAERRGRLPGHGRQH
jgi:hypothetical protein